MLAARQRQARRVVVKLRRRADRHRVEIGFRVQHVTQRRIIGDAVHLCVAAGTGAQAECRVRAQHRDMLIPRDLADSDDPDIDCFTRRSFKADRRADLYDKYRSAKLFRLFVRRSTRAIRLRRCRIASSRRPERGAACIPQRTRQFILHLHNNGAPHAGERRDATKNSARKSAG